jgi:hypothetical protein
MGTLRISALALGVILAASGVASAHEKTWQVSHQKHYAAYTAVSPKATAFVPLALKRVEDDSDGLSRNTNECNRGCIDN